MKAVIQKVNHAKVVVKDSIIAEINFGLLVFLGIEKRDTEKNLVKLANKIYHYRIFSDENHKMNLSLKNVKGELLIVSQFTIAATTNKGLRPSFSSSETGTIAEQYYLDFIEYCKKNMDIRVQSGVFGADMRVILENIGPTTFILAETP